VLEWQSTTVSSNGQDSGSRFCDETYPQSTYRDTADLSVDLFKYLRSSIDGGVDIIVCLFICNLLQLHCELEISQIGSDTGCDTS
jgi:hypothetical protein